jgi:hypothetical protein
MSLLLSRVLLVNSSLCPEFNLLCVYSQQQKLLNSQTVAEAAEEAEVQLNKCQINLINGTNEIFS